MYQVNLSGSYNSFNKFPATASATTINTVFALATEDPKLLERDAIALVDEAVGVAPEGLLAALPVVFDTKNQSAATGSPRFDLSANWVRLNPTRLKTDAVMFAKNETYSAGMLKSAGSL